MTLKRTVFIAAAVLVMLLMCSFCQADDINLLKNADFLRIGNDGLPDGWYTDAYISEPGYTSFGISEGDPSHPVAVTIQNIGEMMPALRRLWKLNRTLCIASAVMYALKM